MQLKPYQVTGAHFLASNTGAILADEMGLGKTAQAIEAMKQVGGKVLIVCPASLKLNWRDEIMAWGLPEPFVVFSGNIEPADITIINYDILKKNKKFLINQEFNVIVFDEAHYLKNPQTNRTKAAMALTAKHRWMLTGTPILNRPIELWPLLFMCDPATWANKRKFIDRYCDPKIISTNGFKHWDINGASNAEELAERLAPMMLRRMKMDVLDDLPEKTRQVILFPPDSREVKDAIKIEREAASKLKGAEYLGAIASARRMLGEAKIEASIEHIKNVLEETAKVVVFAHHKVVINRLFMGLSAYSPVMITGETSSVERHRVVERFQKQDARVFIGNLQAAGTGLTLTAASVAVFVEQDWTPGILAQAEDRIHRIGQKANALIQYLVFDGSLDANMAKTVARKEETINTIVKRSEPCPLIIPLKALPQVLNVSPPRWRPLSNWKSRLWHIAKQIQ